MKKFLGLVTLVVCLWVSGPVMADALFFHDGRFMEGTILVDMGGAWFFSSDEGEKAWYDRSQVAAVSYGNGWEKKYDLEFIDGVRAEAAILDDECDYILIAQEPGTAPEKIEKSDLKHLPEEWRNDVVSSYWIDKKREGWYITAIPLVGYSNDNGFRGGGRVYFYDNGQRSDPSFAKYPYGLRTYIQFTASTQEMFEGKLDLDWNAINGTIFGFEARFEVEQMNNGLYFGSGSRTTSEPLTDHFGQTYTTYGEYEKALASQTAMDKYNNYQYLTIQFVADMTVDIAPHWHVYSGYRFHWIDITDWNSQGNYTTLLGRDKPLGYHGGFISALRAGAAFDLRDFAPDPKKGVYLSADMEGALSIIGSSYDYFAVDLEARGYYTFWKILTFAGRAAYRTSTVTPFYNQNTLGGYSSLRGFLVNRFAGTTVTLFNLETRIHAMEFLLWKQRFGIKFVGFFDAGNAYSSFEEPFSDPRFHDYRISGGGGIIGTWNQSTVMHLYIGFSEEDMGISINFGHSF